MSAWASNLSLGDGHRACHDDRACVAVVADIDAFMDVGASGRKQRWKNGRVPVSA